MGSVGLKKASEVGMSQEECLESEAQEAYEPSNSELLEVLAAQPPADNGGSPFAPWGAPGGSPGGQPGGRPGGAGGAIGGDLSAVAELALPDWARDLDDEAAEGISEGLSLGWGAMVDLGSAARKEAVDAGKVALVENKDVKGMKRSAGEWSTSWVTGGPSADDPAVKAKVDAQTRDIPNQDIIYEQLAHGAAYGKFAPAQLAAWGYGPLRVVINEHWLTGICVVAAVPLRLPKLPNGQLNPFEAMHGRPLRPVLAFRGSSDAVNWKDDAMIQGIGSFCFEKHKNEIADGLAMLAGEPGDGRVDLVGHSLGGALAQMAATLGPTGRIVTFQAPGAGEMASQIPEDVESTHHRARNDVVPWAGGAHTSGATYEYDHEGVDTPGDHASFLLNGMSEERGIPMVFDTSVFGEENYHGEAITQQKLAKYDDADLVDVSRGSPDWTGDGEVDPMEQAYVEGRGLAAETGRLVAGGAMLVEDTVHDGIAAMVSPIPAPLLKFVNPQLAIYTQGGSMTDGLTNLAGVHLSGGQEGEQNMRDMALLVETRRAIDQAIANGQTVTEQDEILAKSGLPRKWAEDLKLDLDRRR